MERGRKKKAVRAIVNNLHASPDIKPYNVLIVLHEPPLDNWSISGGKPASEFNLALNIHV